MFGLWLIAAALMPFAFGGQALAQAQSQSQTQAQAPSSGSPALQAPLVSDPDYALGVGDVVDIVVVGSQEFSTRARVGNDGQILLPLMGPIKAGGVSSGALAEDISAALKKGGFFASPVVRVELVGIRSRYVTVLGYVGTPGLIPLDRPYRLSEILARIGGKGNGGANYMIVTSATGASNRYPIDSLATGGPDKDPVVQSGDKIYIPAAEMEVYYLNGEIRSPGAFPIQTDLTVRIAIAKAGGVTENGNEKKVKIVRGGETLKGVTPDTKIQAGDLVSVGARMF